MATVCNLDYDSLAGNFSNDYKDSVTARYTVQFDASQTSPYTVFAAAQLATPDPVPLRGEYLSGTLLLAKRFSVVPNDASRKLWHITTTYETPDPGEDQGQQNANPLLRPPILNVEYMETEYVIDKAKNVEELSHGDGKGVNRAADTEGPIVNAAGKRPDEPIVDTERNPVLVIQRNFAALSNIVTLNTTYKGSTNSDTPEGFAVRTLKYLLTESQGMQTENDTTFWPGITRIEVKKTTDVTLDNVGYEYWDATDSDWVRAKDSAGEPMSEPINLKLDGDKGGDNSTTITWRYLTEKTYAPLVS